VWQHREVARARKSPIDVDPDEGPARPEGPAPAPRAAPLHEPVDPDGDAPEGEEQLLTLEDLAAVSGVPPRTIRFYQAEKLLQRPERDRKDARMARYGPHHVERLRLVGELRDRGLKLPAIRTLLQEGDASTRVADWLGLDETLRGSFGPDAPRLMPREDLARLLDGTPVGTQGHLEDAGLLVRQGDAWLLPAPALLDIAVRLITDGVHVDLVLKAGAILQQHLGRAAEELIDLFVAAMKQGYGTGAEPATLVEALRPAAGDAARVVFGLQLERAIAALLADTKRLGRR
jgi:DNA-binding transcriptional MerR regulator